MAPDELISPGGLSYEEALAAILALNGTWVRVRVFGLLPLAGVAYFEGLLDSTRNVRHQSHSGEGEAMWLTFKDAPHRVELAPKAFSRAGFITLGSDKGVLSITQGATAVHLDGREAN